MSRSVQRIAVLGSTGSIGRSALRVIARHPDRFRVVALTAHSSAHDLAAQVEATAPEYIGLVQDGAGVPPGWRVGREALVEAASHARVDTVINAIVGAAGLDATLAALEAGKRVALANKESLVVAGALVGAAAARGGGSIVPVDSEHSAILQCLATRPAHEVSRLVITASGGPFRTWPSDRLREATLADALKHPTWSMGKKITVDSATLANKALEVIEAHFLFGIPFDRIEVVVHPQSIVHSMVEFVDGSVVAQLGVPSMELPILYALTHPERIVDDGVPRLDPVTASPLTFEPVRHEDFPALRLGVGAGRDGGAAPAIFNAANEQAVALFLAGVIRFQDISSAIESALRVLRGAPGGDKEALLAADAAARQHVKDRFAC
ncbi:MAG: 1-deoxy-D-xylulose-5-phosphate reductoisomerase [Gemmatimonadetes bacterium]|nr:1-deoxy-D-xylulose-5-phosphate reductoisomerase [Gemmatimonadota bacterium]MCC7324030.1 1-deoxy-D-xylulose-5-phosphate reductoisomerase [Gemmatimonadaceae bacterium]MBK6841881.1 1-deoxy-D-xylulose-5-phosphate reductoisomerase [Gemmatimonadota bacterium]MBK8061978.1 1-deoxy-D-xylulose-5-phosphate reductoisomerase [Gemmatimonadota bacterium]MBK8645633.1 1-deoxy-D-xylulose-5-phosphate reductoisomerase [Gemmatimonadota bacterium]